MSNFSQESRNSRIADSYVTISNLIPPDSMREIVHAWFDQFLEETRKKKTPDKCVKFFLFRQMLIAHLIPELDEKQQILGGNSLVDYIDMTFAYLFFNAWGGHCALERRVDNELYFCLLAFALDRIEFPSLVQESIKESYRRNNRHKIGLDRRNHLATTMYSSRVLVNSAINSILQAKKSPPTYDEVRRICEKNRWHLMNMTSVAHAKSAKQLSKMKHDDAYRVYRGYEINPDQDVIVDRKIRLQDANKSISFTTSRNVAQTFANYRTYEISDPNATTYDDRVTLAETMFTNDVVRLKKTGQKKCIVSEYLVNAEDIIFYPMTTTITECEVFAIPDNAKLTRYSIVNSI